MYDTINLKTNYYYIVVVFYTKMCAPNIDIQAILLCMVPTLAMAFTFNMTYAILFAMTCVVVYYIYIWGCFTIQDYISTTVEMYMQKEIEEFTLTSQLKKEEEDEEEDESADSET